MSNFNQGFKSWNENIDIFVWNKTHKQNTSLSCMVSVLIVFVYQTHISSLSNYAA